MAGNIFRQAMEADKIDDMLLSDIKNILNQQSSNTVLQNLQAQLNYNNRLIL